MNYKSYFWLLMIIFFVFDCGNNKNNNSYTGVLEGTSINVPALTGGKIIELLVNTGDKVEKSQRLAIIDSTELTYQRQQLQATRTELNVQTKIATTALACVQKDLSYIEEKHERIKKLYENKSIPKQNLDDISNQLQTVKSGFTTAQQKLQSIAARREQLQAQIKIIEKKIKDTVVFAPCQGIVVTKYFETGEAIPRFSPLVEIIDISKMTTKIYISEKQLVKVKHGQKVTVSIDGLDRKLSGRVSWISPKAEFTPKNILTPETRTSLVYAVKISINNEDGVLKQGMPVVVELSNWVIR